MLMHDSIYWKQILGEEEAFGGSTGPLLMTHVSAERVIPAPAHHPIKHIGILFYALDRCCYWLKETVPPEWWVAVGGPALDPQDLGCPSLCWAQQTKWQVLNKNNCSRQHSNKSNPIYSLIWDVAMSWKVHHRQFPGLVTISAISFCI